MHPSLDYYSSSGHFLVKQIANSTLQEFVAWQGAIRRIILNVEMKPSYHSTSQSNLCTDDLRKMQSGHITGSPQSRRTHEGTVLRFLGPHVRNIIGCYSDEMFREISPSYIRACGLLQLLKRSKSRKMGLLVILFIYYSLISTM